MDEDNVLLDFVASLCKIASLCAIIIAAIVLLYRIVRPHFPVIVNCWFCNKDSKVPHGNKSCWDCPFCEQYNGFTEDGDYNKAIPAQYNEAMNHPVSQENCQKSAFKTGASALCDQCNRNQLLKIRQLANFVPYNETNYDMEVEGYKYHLEQIYRTCQVCQLRVDKVIFDIDKRVQGNQKYNPNVSTISNHDSSSTLNDSYHCNSHISCHIYAPTHVKLLRMCSVVCAVSLFLTCAMNLLDHSDSSLSASQFLPKSVLIYCKALHKGITLVVVLGLITGLIAIYRFGKQSLHICDAVCSMSWLLCLAVHSKAIAKQMTTEDKILLQALCATFNLIVCLWGALCQRFDNTSTVKTIKKKRKYLNLSGSSISSFSERNSPVKKSPQKSPQEKGNVAATSGGDHHIGDKFETMSIGTPSHSSSPGIFHVKQGQQDSPPLQPNLRSLRHKRVLISPARFKHTSARNGSKKSVGNIQTSVPTQRNLGQQSLFKSASQQDLEDRESLFSVPRSNNNYTDSEDEDSNSRSSQNSCDQEDVNLAEQQINESCSVSAYKDRRSVCMKVLVGASIGINLALIVYFVIDFNSMLTSFESLKQNTRHIYMDVLNNSNSSEPWSDGLINFSKTLYGQFNRLMTSLTQEIPGEDSSAYEE